MRYWYPSTYEFGGDQNVAHNALSEDRVQGVNTG